MYRLSNWTLVDMGAFVVAHGNAYGNPYFGVGDSIITCPIVDLQMDIENQRIVLTTEAKTKYVLRLSEIDVDNLSQIKKVMDVGAISEELFDICVAAVKEKVSEVKEAFV